MGGWNLKSSKWANPFTVKECGTVEVAIEKYRDYVLHNYNLLKDLHELEGMDVGVNLDLVMGMF